MPAGPPHPPFVEVGIYDDARSEQEVFQGFLDCLVDRGARPTGRGRALKGVGPTGVFEGPTDPEALDVRVDRLEDVHQLVGPDERLVEVEVAGGVGDPSRAARLTYLRVERVHLATDRHPVALWASGDAFSGPATGRTRAAGKEVRQLFEAVVNVVDPAYGAVTVDVPLASPGQIVADTACWWDYRNFYVSRAYVGAAAFSRIADASSGLDVTLSSKGLFVFSTSAFGGPDGNHEPAARAFTHAIAARAQGGAP